MITIYSYSDRRDCRRAFLDGWLSKATSITYKIKWESKTQHNAKVDGSE